MDFLFLLFFLFIFFKIFKNVITGGTDKKVDWGNVGAQIQNAQKVMKEVSNGTSSYNLSIQSRSANNTSSHIKSSTERRDIARTREHLREIQKRIQDKANSNSGANIWSSSSSSGFSSVKSTRSSKQSSLPSHKRNHVHSGTDYSMKDYFKNDSVPVHVALKSCKPAVNKGWFDKGDHGPTVDRG